MSDCRRPAPLPSFVVRCGISLLMVSIFATRAASQSDSPWPFGGDAVDLPTRFFSPSETGCGQISSLTVDELDRVYAVHTEGISVYDGQSWHEVLNDELECPVMIRAIAGGAVIVGGRRGSLGRVGREASGTWRLRALWHPDAELGSKVVVAKIAGVGNRIVFALEPFGNRVNPPTTLVEATLKGRELSDVHQFPIGRGRFWRLGQEIWVDTDQKLHRLTDHRLEPVSGFDDWPDLSTNDGSGPQLVRTHDGVRILGASRDAQVKHNAPDVMRLAEASFGAEETHSDITIVRTSLGTVLADANGDLIYQRAKQDLPRMLPSNAAVNNSGYFMPMMFPCVSAIDRQGGLWFVQNQNHAKNGIVRVQYQARFRSFDERHGIKGRLRAAAHFENHDYFGGSKGLFVGNESAGRLRFDRLFPDQLTNISQLLVAENSLLVFTTDGVFALRGGKLQAVSSFDKRVRWTVVNALHDGSVLVARSFFDEPSQVQRLKRVNDQWRLTGTFEAPWENAKSMVSAGPKQVLVTTFGNDNRLKETWRFDPTEQPPQFEVVPQDADFNHTLVRFEDQVYTFAPGGTDRKWTISRYDQTNGTFRPDEAMTALLPKGKVYRIISATADFGSFWFCYRATQGGPDRCGRFRRGENGISLEIFPVNVCGHLKATEDGKLWLISGSLQLFDPAENARPLPKLNVHAASLGQNGQFTPLDTQTRLVSGRGGVRFSFPLIIHNANTPVTYRSRLKGLESDWSPLSQLSHREFASLPGGEFTFEVEAMVDGKSVHPTPITFSVLSPWHRRAGTLAVCVIGLVVLSTGIVAWVAWRKNRRIDSLQQTQKQLSESEERYRALVETTQDLIWATDREFRYTYINERFREALGDETRILGTSLFDHVVEDEADDVRVRLHEAMRARTSYSAFTWHARDSHGGTRIVESSGTPAFDENGELIGYRGIDRDITERVELLDQLHRSQKLEAVGQMASGLAHDFNNILTVVSAHAAFAEEATHDSEKSMSEIHDAVERGGELTRRLLSFGTGSRLKETLLSPDRVIADLHSMLRRLIREDIDLVFDLAAPGVAIRADSSRFEQMIVNLVINAGHAMASGGRLSVQTRHFIESNMIEIQIADTGIGIPPENLARIFEPFFTTKEGTGTGLGLATSSTFAEEAGGTISVTSEMDVGTTFSIRLPTDEEDLSAGHSPVEEFAPEGNERILVCDDDARVLHASRCILEDAGYHVFATQCPGEAIQKVSSGEEQFDLLLTDMVMPTTHGLSLAREITAAVPDIRVLFISGYTGECIEEVRLPARWDFLSKPYRPETLLKRIRKLFEQPIA